MWLLHYWGLAKAAHTHTTHTCVRAHAHYTRTHALQPCLASIVQNKILRSNFKYVYQDVVVCVCIWGSIAKCMWLDIEQGLIVSYTVYDLSIWVLHNVSNSCVLHMCWRLSFVCGVLCVRVCVMKYFRLLWFTLRSKVQLTSDLELVKQFGIILR